MIRSAVPVTAAPAAITSSAEGSTIERGGERGRVRLAAREGAGRARPRKTEPGVTGKRDQSRGDDRAHDDAVRSPAAAAHRTDEARPTREPDRVDKECKPEHPERVGQLQPVVESAESDTREHDRCDPQRESADPDPADREPERRNDEQEQNRVRRERVGDERANHRYVTASAESVRSARRLLPSRLPSATPESASSMTGRHRTP